MGRVPDEGGEDVWNQVMTWTEGTKRGGLILGAILLLSMLYSVSAETQHVEVMIRSG